MPASLVNSTAEAVIPIYKNVASHCYRLCTSHNGIQHTKIHTLLDMINEVKLA